MQRRQKHWYLIWTKPRQEALAQENLNRQGYETYYPLYSTTVRCRGRYQTRIEPMFPRYIFIYLDTLNDNWSPIRSTLGVATLVRFTEMPASVPDELIKLLRANEDEQGIQRIKPTELQEGDEVRVIDGVFAGYQGILDTRLGKDRVAVLLDMADRHTRIELTRHDLKRA